jgi:hypothetical protein
VTSAFQGDLEEQPDAEPGYILENLAPEPKTSSTSAQNRSLGDIRRAPPEP